MNSPKSNRKKKVSTSTSASFEHSDKENNFDFESLSLVYPPSIAKTVYELMKKMKVNYCQKNDQKTKQKPTTDEQAMDLEYDVLWGPRELKNLN